MRLVLFPPDVLKTAGAAQGENSTSSPITNGSPWYATLHLADASVLGRLRARSETTNTLAPPHRTQPLLLWERGTGLGEWGESSTA